MFRPDYPVQKNSSREQKIAVSGAVGLKVSREPVSPDVPIGRNWNAEKDSYF